MKNVSMAKFLEFIKHLYQKVFNMFSNNIFIFYIIIFVAVLSCLVMVLNTFSNDIFMLTIISMIIVLSYLVLNIAKFLKFIKYILNKGLITITFVCLVLVYSIEVGVSILQFDHCNSKEEEQIDNPGSEVEKPIATSDKNSSENFVDWLSGFFVCTEKEEKFNHRGILSDYILHKIVYFTTQTSIILMIVIFIYLTIVAHRNYQQKLKKLKELRYQNLIEQKKKRKLEKKLEKENFSRFLTEILIGSLGISAIPTGISLAICAFYDIGLIKYMSGVEVYIAFAGISIVSIGFLSTEQEQKEITKKGMAKVGNPKETDALEPEKMSAPKDSKSYLNNTDMI